MSEATDSLLDVGMHFRLSEVVRISISVKKREIQKANFQMLISPERYMHQNYPTYCSSCPCARLVSENTIKKQGYCVLPTNTNNRCSNQVWVLISF